MSRILQLEEQIKQYSQAYYEGDSVISDEAFDALIDELRDIDPNHPLLHQVGWGYDVTQSNLKKVKHTYSKVGSLKKVKSAKATEKELGDAEAVKTPKIDGLTIMSYYVNGSFTRGVTRGNGFVGQDVTMKIKDKVVAHIEGFTGAIRGEFSLPISSWKEHYPDNPSPRNLAAGVANRKSVSDEELTRFRYTVYQVSGSNIDFKHKSEMMLWLKSVGFEDVIGYSFIKPSDCDPDMMKAELEKASIENDLMLDGWVLTHEDLEMDGTTVVSNQIAYKVENESAETVVKEIRWNLTRTGTYVPVAILEPTELSGATIRRASVYNAEYVESNKIGKGARVQIVRSGEIIPVVTKVIEPSDESLPTHTSTGEELVRVGVDLKLASADSQHLVKSRLMHWTDRIAPVDGLGEKMISKTFEELEINCIQDIYTKSHNFELLKLMDGFGESTTAKIEEMFKKLNEPITPKKFLVALGLPSLGGKSAEKLAEEVGISGIITGELENGRKIKGVSKTAIAGVIDNVDLITEIASMVVLDKSKPAESSTEEVKFVVAMTGKLEGGRKRSELQALVKKNGIGVGDVKEGTKYLITNNPDPTSSKGKKAKKLGVEIITEADFLSKYGLSY